MKEINDLKPIEEVDVYLKDLEKLPLIKGDKGDKGDDGKTPIKGIDYLTEEEILQIENELAGMMEESIPKNTSQLTNDSDFQTGEQVNKTVGDAIKGVTQFDYQVVDQLPETGKKGTIYLIANDKEKPNMYSEYIWINDSFELIGNTEIDLSGYVTKEDFEAFEQDVKKKMDEYLDLIEKSCNTVEGNGSDVTLNNTVEARFKKLRMEGNSWQATASIKNILKVEDFSTSKTGITFSCTDGKFKILGTATANTSIYMKDYVDLDYINKFSGKTVTFSIAEQIIPSDNKFSIQFAVSGNAYYMQLQNRSFASRVLDTEITQFYIYVANGNTVDVEFHLQLEEGSEATEYEPYGAMPSPERPSDIRNVGDNGNVNIKITNNLEQEQVISFPLKEGQVLHKGDYLASDGVHQVRKTIELDGTVNKFSIAHPTIYTATHHFFRIDISDRYSFSSSKNGSTKYCLCNYLKISNQTSASNAIKETCLWWEGASKVIYCSLPYTSTSVNNPNNWLKELKEKGTPVLFEYQTETETVEPYSPEQQQAYNELMSMTSYEETTHIFSEDEISPIFNIIAYAKGTNTVQKQPSQITNEPNMSEPQNDSPSMEEDIEAGEVEE